jgi:hypothetical protein
MNVLSSSEDKHIEHAQHLIKMYHLAKDILKYNQKLYICNLLMLKELGQYTSDLFFGEENKFEPLINQLKKYSIKCDSDECEVYMIMNRLKCAPYRFILSDQLGIELCTYQKESFQTLRNIDVLNLKTEKCEIMWLVNGKEPTGIAPNQQFLALVAAQKAMICKYESELSAR